MLKIHTGQTSKTEDTKSYQIPSTSSSELWPEASELFI